MKPMSEERLREIEGEFDILGDSKGWYYWKETVGELLAEVRRLNAILDLCEPDNWRKGHKNNPV